MDRRQAMLSAATSSLALLPLPLLVNKPKKKWEYTCGGRAPVITIHIVHPWDGRYPDPVIDATELSCVPSGHRPCDWFIKWKRNGRLSDKVLVILRGHGHYTVEKMAKELNMQCCPVHDCIKFVVRDGKCVPIPV